MLNSRPRMAGGASLVELCDRPEQIVRVNRLPFSAPDGVNQVGDTLPGNQAAGEIPGPGNQMVLGLLTGREYLDPEGPALFGEVGPDIPDKGVQIDLADTRGDFGESDVPRNSVRAGQPRPREVLGLRQAVEPAKDPADPVGRLGQGLDEDPEAGKMNLQAPCVPDEPPGAGGRGPRGFLVDVVHGNHPAPQRRGPPTNEHFGMFILPGSPRIDSDGLGGLGGTRVRAGT